MERILDKSEKGYKNLVAVAKVLEALSPNGYEYSVEDTYLDYGQDWKWSTIIRHYPEGHWCGSVQVLCPRDWKAIVLADSLDDLAKVIEVIRSDKYFNDKEVA